MATVLKLWSCILNNPPLGSFSEVVSSKCQYRYKLQTLYESSCHAQQLSFTTLQMYWPPLVISKCAIKLSLRWNKTGGKVVAGAEWRKISPLKGHQRTYQNTVCPCARLMTAASGCHLIAFIFLLRLRDSLRVSVLSVLYELIL